MFGQLEDVNMTDRKEETNFQEVPSDRKLENSANELEIAESGLNTDENQNIHKITQAVHNLEMSATNLIVPKSSSESLGLIDEEKGIIHTGAGMLPVIPDESSLSYAEKLKAIRPAKSESELEKKKADATLEWMRDKGFDAVKDFEFRPSPLPLTENAAEYADDRLPAISENQIELYNARRQVNGQVLFETGISTNVISNPWQAFKTLPPEQQRGIVEAFQKAQNVAQDSIHETADDILKRTLDGYIDTVKFPINFALGVGNSLWQILEFEHDLLVEPALAQEKSATVGTSIGKALVIGVKLWSGLVDYGSDVQEEKDYKRPFQDLGNVLNSWFESLTPGDQMNALAGISAGFGIGALGKQIKQLSKPGIFLQFLEEAAESAPKNPETERKFSATITKILDFVANKKRFATTDGIATPADKIEDYILRMVGRNGIHMPERRPLFLAPGENRILKPYEVEALGGLQTLERMNEAELANLSIKRFEMPKMILETDPFSFLAKIPGDPKAWVQASSVEEGVVVLQYIGSGNLPAGTGNILLSECLKGHGQIPWKRLHLKTVLNEESLEAFYQGALPEEILVGRMSIKTLHELGVKVKSMNYKWDQGLKKLDIIIETER